MTVELYTGPVGSGKSYCALDRVWNRLRHGGGVVSNVPLTGWKAREVRRGLNEKWIHLPDDELTPENLIRISVERGWWGHESSAFLMIDEAAVMFNSREWQRGDRTGWIKFLNHSRKIGYDVILITQSKNMLDKQIRESCEFVVKHVNLRRYKWLSWMPWRVFLQVAYWQMGNFRGTTRWIPFRKSLAKRYDTMAVFDVGMAQLLARVESEVQPASPEDGGSLAPPVPAEWQSVPTEQGGALSRQWGTSER